MLNPSVAGTHCLILYSENKRRNAQSLQCSSSGLFIYLFCRKVWHDRTRLNCVYTTVIIDCPYRSHNPSEGHLLEKSLPPGSVHLMKQGVASLSSHWVLCY